jgi:putative heme-binding domain-containing protein
VLTTKGDPAWGKAVFAKRCAQCHKLEDVGHVVGPDFAAIKDRSPAAMLVAILDPNRAVEDRYVEYSVELKDGRVFAGIIGEETTNSLTLVGPEGKRQSVLRIDIASLKSLGRSLMPEGMEKDLTKQDLADVLAYVAGRAPPAKAFPGNTPALVKANDKGELWLLGTNARISGPSIVFEEKYKNLGYWSSPDDRAEWTAEIAKAGKFRVVLDFACDRGAAGDEILVQVGPKSLRLKVPGTGTWDDYRTQEIGVVELPAGPVSVIARSADTIRQALIDLRGIRLLPGP